MPTIIKRTTKPLSPGVKPYQTIIKDLDLRSTAEAQLNQTLPAIFKKLLAHPPLGKTDHLVKGAAVYARAIAAQQLVYTWSEYSKVLTKAAKTAHRLHIQIDHRIVRKSANSSLPPIEVGLQKIIQSELPADISFLDTITQIANAIERANTIASEKAREKVAPNEDFRKLLDIIVKISKHNFLALKLPQKEKANDGDVDLNDYELLRFTLEVERLALAAAKHALKQCKLANHEAAIAEANVRPKSHGTVVYELRLALQREKMAAQKRKKSFMLKLRKLRAINRLNSKEMRAKYP